jgi:hypothetical protein
VHVAIRFATEKAFPVLALRRTRARRCDWCRGRGIWPNAHPSDYAGSEGDDTRQYESDMDARAHQRGSIV